MSSTLSSKRPEQGEETPALEIRATQAIPAGLTREQARQRLSEFGANAIAEEPTRTVATFLAKFWAPVPWLLEVAMIVEIGLGKYVEAGVIAGLLLFNATLGYLQEGRASAALAALKQRLAPTALARRDGKWSRIPATEVVPGDTLRLSLGALVPADARILSGAVMVDQSMLTGESIPVDVDSGGQLYAGSLVQRGQAIAEVVATGPKTRFGRAAELVRASHAPSSEQAAIFAAARSLAVVNAAIGIGIVVYAYWTAMSSPDLVRLALTALLATIPAALPATFTLSAALSAQTLAGRGVLLTRLSAVHEAAAMDVLCADKTGTLTRNTLEVAEVAAMPGFDRAHVLSLAALASSEADQDPIDRTIRLAAGQTKEGETAARLLRFTPFDPATRRSEALVLDHDGSEIRVLKGALEAVMQSNDIPARAYRDMRDLAARGHRVIAVAIGTANVLRLAGLIAISDPPRADAPRLVATLRDLGVRSLMVTGDSAATAAAIATQVGIVGAVCQPESEVVDEHRIDEFAVFARVAPEAKHRLVTLLQHQGYVVGMCGDGTNDAPALRQAQMGIAVSSATDVAKAAAGMVLTEPGLGGVVFAVREGRVAFQRLLTYTLNMLTKKVEIVLFLAVGLVLTGHAIMTPALMVLMLVTNDFLAMSLTTDRASPSPAPSAWHMPNVTRAAVALGAAKLVFSTTVLAAGKFVLRLGPAELQTLAFITLIFGSQGLLYALRERHRMWSSRPGKWVVAASIVDITIVAALARTGVLMAPLPSSLLAGVFVAAIGLAIAIDRIKLPIRSAFGLE